MYWPYCISDDINDDTDDDTDDDVTDDKNNVIRDDVNDNKRRYSDNIKHFKLILFELLWRPL